jgi:hypothetical protein
MIQLGWIGHLMSDEFSCFNGVDDARQRRRAESDEDIVAHATSVEDET